MLQKTSFDLARLFKQLKQAQQDVSQICEPILEFFGIKYFELYRVYPDNSFIVLTTHPEWVHFYFSNHFFEITDTDCHERLSQYDFVLWNRWPESDTAVWEITQQANNFDLTNTITLICKNEEALNAFSFGAPTKSVDIDNKYLVNMSVLEKFAYYFLSKAHKLIEESNKLKSRLPVQKRDSDKNNFLEKNEIMKCLDIKNIPFFIDNKEVVLTEKETKISLYYLQGISAKRIAHKLNASNRTIEWHIENIKQKLGCYSKTHLCEKLNQNPILNYLKRIE